MGAIVGIFCLDERPVDRSSVERMLRSLDHRGPDGSDIWTKDNLGLGVCLLHTTPESKWETQPLQKGKRVIVADARIDNRDELLTILEKDNPSLRQAGDAALILAAYERWGDKVPEHLIGDFAFAIWDSDRRILFCARDPMGVKPFYYHFSDKLFVFGSEIKALLQLQEVPRIPNEQRIYHYLQNNQYNAEITFYEGIARLPAAHAFCLSRGGVRRWQYWKPDTDYELQLGSSEEYFCELRDRFADAVQSRLRSTTPVGVLLSGGLDSSSVACMARTLRGPESTEPVHTFSGIFPGLSKAERKVVDERDYIDAVLDGGGFKPHFTRGDRLTSLYGMEEMLRLNDEPFLLCAQNIVFALYGLAREAGIRVMLDGAEGDQAITHGINYFGTLARQGRWEEFGRLAFRFDKNLRQQHRQYGPRIAFEAFGAKALAATFTKGNWLRFAKDVNLIARSFNISHKRILYNTSLQLVPGSLRSLISEDHTKKSGMTPSFVDQRFVRRATSKQELPTFKTQRELHGLALQAGLLQGSLEFTDKLAAWFGIEPRHPFYDRRLLDFLVALPAAIIFHNGWTRGVMRYAMEGVLPEKVRWRVTKSRFGDYFAQTLARDGCNVLYQHLIRDVDAISAYIVPERLKQHVEQFTRQPSGGAAMQLQRPLMLSMWLRNSPSSLAA